MTYTRRVQRFATSHGLLCDPSPRDRPRPLRPTAAHIFHMGTLDAMPDALEWFGVPGEAGFEFGRHRCRFGSNAGENAASTITFSYAVFTLRATYPHSVIHPPRFPVVFPRSLTDFGKGVVPDAPRHALASAAPDDPCLGSLLHDGVGAALAVHPGLALELVENELFLYTARFLSRRRALRVWRTFAQLLAPRLARPPRTTDLAQRQRAGIRREVRDR